MLSIDLPLDLNNRLELLSLSTGRTMQFYVLEALLEYLTDVEDRYTSAEPLILESLSESDDDLEFDASGFELRPR
jgi:predicted DNA-binding protein